MGGRALTAWLDGERVAMYLTPNDELDDFDLRQVDEIARRLPAPALREFLAQARGVQRAPHPSPSRTGARGRGSVRARAPRRRVRRPSGSRDGPDPPEPPLGRGVNWRAVVQAAIDALEAGDIRLAVQVLLGALEDGDVVDPHGRRRRCPRCSAGPFWPGEFGSHRCGRREAA
jgi:hypothetical protein